MNKQPDLEPPASLFEELSAKLNPNFQGGENRLSFISKVVPSNTMEAHFCQYKKKYRNVSHDEKIILMVWIFEVKSWKSQSSDF